MNIPKRKYKIALVSYTLNSGGLERVMSSLSLYFGEQGIEVHNVVFVDDVGYPFSGTLLNIGKMKEQHKGVIGKLKLLGFFNRFIKDHRFDFIIDFRYHTKPFQEVLIANWIYKANTIYTVHSGNIATYIPKNKFLANLIFKDKYAVVCVSDEIMRTVEKRYRFPNLVKINNPIPVEEIQRKSEETIPLDFPYVIGMGRFDHSNVKQFDKLIETYLESDLPQKNIHLVLLGDGERRNEIEATVKDPKIHFLGFKENPYPYLKKALFLVLSSKYEGFPMSVVETMACGTPVVAFDCVSGPDEIITDRENGLLVENQNFDALKEKINLFVSDSELYQNCKAQTEEAIRKFSMDKIGKEWMELMKIEVLS